MKFGELKSIAHNIADSLASGCGLLIGVYVMDIFGEAAASSAGFILVDFLTGETSGGRTSPHLADAIRLYARALPGLCERHGAGSAPFAVLTAHYGVDRTYGGHFTVTVEDRAGRRSVDRYVGLPGKRVRTRRPA